MEACLVGVSVLWWSWWLLRGKKKRESWSVGEIELGTAVEWWALWRGSRRCVVESKRWDPCGIGRVDMEGLVGIGGVVELASGVGWLSLGPPNYDGIGERAGRRCRPRTCWDPVEVHRPSDGPGCG